MTDVCILFMYYDGAPHEALLQNWNRMKAYNTGEVVVPLIHDGKPTFPETIDLRTFPTYGWVTENGHRSCDTMIYRWFLNRQFDAERYVVYEWDTFATTSVREFYRPVWDAEVACRAPVEPVARPDWPFFQDIPSLPEALQSFAAGLAPLAATMFSHKALERMMACPLIPDAFAELRSGTMASWAGLTVSPMLYAKGKVSWHEDFINVSPAPSLYHPVKKVLRPRGRFF